MLQAYAIPVPSNDGWILWLSVILLVFVVALLAALVAFAWCIAQHLSRAVARIEKLEAHRAKHARQDHDTDRTPAPRVESPAPITRPGPVVPMEGPSTIEFRAAPSPIRQFR